MNIYTFQGVSWSVEEILKGAHSWTNQYISICKGGITMRPNLSTEMVEIGMWICIRSDGVVNIKTSYVAAGGVLRDHNGKWILGFNRRLRKCSTNNMEVIGATKESLANGSNFALIRCILHLLQNEEDWSIDYVSRDENMEADGITKLAFGRDEGVQLYEDILV
ncbi:hypothetical protein Goari_019658, partial [Gossypium aridum]|nr:hypothetical protein [Gossypium aridum]